MYAEYFYIHACYFFDFEKSSCSMSNRQAKPLLLCFPVPNLHYQQDGDTFLLSETSLLTFVLQKVRLCPLDCSSSFSQMAQYDKPKIIQFT